MYTLKMLLPRDHLYNIEANVNLSERPHPLPHLLTKGRADGECLVEVSPPGDRTQSVVLLDSLHLLLQSWL